MDFAFVGFGGSCVGTWFGYVSGWYFVVLVVVGVCGGIVYFLAVDLLSMVLFSCFRLFDNGFKLIF